MGEVFFVKENTEEIITKDDIEQENEQNIRRVDNRPGSVFSVIIFAMLFVIVYLLYPQIWLISPIPGTTVDVKTTYRALPAMQMLDADTIVIATAKDEGKTKSYVTNTNPVVYKMVEFEVKEVLKGKTNSTIALPEYGGNALFDASGKKEKFTVNYENAIDFEKGKTYILFVSNGEVMNGKAGALEQNKDGSFTDVTGVTFTKENILTYLLEG